MIAQYSHYIALGVAILFNMVGNHLFKYAGLSNAASGYSKTFFSYMGSGFFFYFFSAILYIFALKKIPLSIAYPSLAITYVLTLFSSYFLFGEELNLTKIIGALVIIAGIAIMNL